MNFKSKVKAVVFITQKSFKRSIASVMVFILTISSIILFFISPFIMVKVLSLGVIFLAMYYFFTFKKNTLINVRKYLLNFWSLNIRNIVLHRNKNKTKQISKNFIPRILINIYQYLSNLAKIIPNSVVLRKIFNVYQYLSNLTKIIARGIISLIKISIRQLLNLIKLIFTNIYRHPDISVLIIFLASLTFLTYLNFESLPLYSLLIQYKNYIIAIAIIFGIASFWLNKEKMYRQFKQETSEKKSSISQKTPYILYGLIATLGIGAISQLAFLLIGYGSFTGQFAIWVSNNQIYFLILSFVYTGFVFFLYHKKSRHVSDDSTTFQNQKGIGSVTLLSGWWQAGMVVIILFTSGYLAFHHIGNHSFAQDETRSVWAAINTILGAGPLHINGEEFSLSFPIVSLASISFKLFGVNEFAARFFNVLFFLGSLVLIYILGKKIVSPEVGLLAMFISGFNTINFAETLELKIYAFMQFLFLFGIYALYRWEKDQWSIQSRWFYLLLGSIFIGLRSYVGYIAFPAIALSYMAGLYWLTHRKTFLLKPISASFLSRPIQLFLLSVTILSTVVYGFLFYDHISYNVTAAGKYLLGIWGQNAANVNSFLFYPTIFFERLPLLVLLIIPSLIFLVRTRKKSGWYLCLFFIIPFLVQDIVIGRKATRYIVYFLPIFFLISITLFDRLFAALPRLWPKRLITTRIITVLLIIVIGSINTPIMKTFALASDPLGTRGDSAILKTHFLWPEVNNYLQSRLNEDDIIISNEFSESAYYLPRPWYSIGCPPENESAFKNHTSAIKWLHGTSSAQYQIVFDVPTFETIINEHNGWFVAFKHRFQQNNCSRPILDYVDQNLTFDQEIRGIKIYRFTAID